LGGDGLKSVGVRKVGVSVMLVLFVVSSYVLVPVNVKMAEAFVVNPAVVRAVATAAASLGMKIKNTGAAEKLTRYLAPKMSEGLKQRLLYAAEAGLLTLGMFWEELRDMVVDIKAYFEQEGDILHRYGAWGTVDMTVPAGWPNTQILYGPEFKIASTDDGVVCIRMIKQEWWKLNEWSSSTYGIESFLLQRKDGDSWVNINNMCLFSSMGSKYHHKFKYNENWINLNVAEGEYFGWDGYIEGDNINFIPFYHRVYGSSIQRCQDNVITASINRDDVLRFGIRVAGKEDYDRVQFVEVTYLQELGLEVEDYEFTAAVEDVVRPEELERKSVVVPGDIGDLVDKDEKDMIYQDAVVTPGVDEGVDSEKGWLENIYRVVTTLPERIAYEVKKAFEVTVDVKAEMGEIKSKFNRKLVGFDTDISSYIDMQDSYDCPVWKYMNPYSGEEYVLINWCEYEEYVGKFKRWLSGILVVMTLAACYQIIKVKVVID
jgi:hypothetical protein